ncbi:FG-GAP repeat domain-containing protein [Neolewinella persica]|uniref:FG-GAP repeat domain-containing protein n=1 Tax=Neolewinella persica TaxID=70998 RepID=UPI00037FFDFD|nr:VCBS repeat-containing protein [Neolewinella persica]
MLRRLSTLFLLCSLIPFLCTCDRAPDAENAAPLFLDRTDTGITSTNQLTETEDWNIVEYLYYYNGGGVAATDINGDDLPDLYFTNNQGPNKYYINEGNFKFRDATNEGGVAGAGDWSTGISVVDVNADGRMDLYVCNVSGYKGLTGRNELFLQNEDGTFTEAAADYGLDFAGFNTQAYWFDYDRDGDLDMYLLRHSVHNDATYGTAKSRDIPDSLAGDLLLRNDLNERPALMGGSQIKNQKSRIETAGGSSAANRESFRDVTKEANLYSSKIAYGLSAAIADFNQDSFPDIYVCNDFSENDYYYLNQGDGTFKESVRELAGHTSNFSMGSDVADFNNDRWPDLLTLDMRPGKEEILKSTMSADPVNVYNIKRKLGYHDQLPRNNLQWNRGDGNFSEIAEMAGLAATDWSWSCLIEDFDLDGRLDVFVANGIERRPNSLDYLKFISSDLARSASNLEVIANMPSGQVANQAFRMTADWAFEEVGAAWGLDFVGSSTGAAVADFDRDGDADLVLNNLNAPAKIYENVYLPKPRSPGAAFNPTSPSKRRYDPDTRLCPQRGMMSQSEGRYGPDRGTAARYTPLYTVTPTGFTRSAALDGFFDQAPLAPFKPKPSNNPALLLKNGDLAISINESGQQYEILHWEYGQLVSVGVEPWLTVKQRLAQHEPTNTLRLAATRAREEIYAQPFAGIRSKQSDGKETSIAPEKSGIWQSLSDASETEEPGTVLLAGNWGLNSGLGNPTSGSPLRLYIEDVDGNGQTEPLLTYVRQGKEITVADKDELAARIPSLKRNNLNYVDYAKQRFQELFPSIQKEPQVVNTLAHLQLVRQNGGNWNVEALPRAAQITTVNCALEVPQGILLGGNKHHVQPRIGRQDAAALQLLREDGSVTFIDLGGARNHQEVRQLVRLDDRHILVVVGEGEHLILKTKN